MAGTRKAGELDDRVKTTVRLPAQVVEDMDEVFRELGLTKNTVMTLGVVDALSKLIPLIQGKNKRVRMINNLEMMFQKSIEDLKLSA